MNSIKATGKLPRSSSSLATVLLLVTLGVATCPCSVQAGKVVKIPASKDATLYSGFRDYCNYAIPPDCSPETYAYCPWCNYGKSLGIAVENYFTSADAVVGFTLKKISGANIKSCTVLFPKAEGGPPGPVNSAAEIRLTDVSFNWNERQVTYSTKPNATKVGSYGRFNLFLGKPVDVTKGCKLAFQNRTASGNGLALSLKVDNTGVADPNFFFYFPSREAGSPAILTITYI